MQENRLEGVTSQVPGQVSALQQIFKELTIGLAAALGVTLLLLTANFQSIRLALVLLSTAPAVLAGSMLMLLIMQAAAKTPGVLAENDVAEGARRSRGPGH